MSNNCLFCSLSKDKKIIDGKLVFVINDAFPITKFHSLIIPKRHFKDFFDITNEELLEIKHLLEVRKDQILSCDKLVSGFNIGVNIGESAGQSIFHLHVHLIPRRLGDIESPKGGVRGVIPEKRSYE